jgi:hypothetical protein
MVYSEINVIMYVEKTGAICCSFLNGDVMYVSMMCYPFLPLHVSQ